jgi:hypothetical protein
METKEKNATSVAKKTSVQKSNAKENNKTKSIKDLSKEELLIKVENLEKVVKSIPESFEKRVEYFEKQKRNINALKAFEKKNNELGELMPAIKAQAEEENNFDNGEERFKIKLVKDRECLVSISTPKIVYLYAEQVQQDIKQKIDELRKSIYC